MTTAAQANEAIEKTTDEVIAAQKPETPISENGPFKNAVRLLGQNKSIMDSLMAERDRLEIELDILQKNIADIDLCLKTVVGNIAMIEGDPQIQKLTQK